LHQSRLKDTRPTIPLGKRFWPLADDEKREIERIFSTEKMRLLVRHCAPAERARAPKCSMPHTG
jgi:hypothetical protein